MKEIKASLYNIDKITFDLGYVGEKNHTRVVINCVSIFKSFPNAVATMTVKPPVGDLYPVVLIREGVSIIWDIAESDIANAGVGQYQLTFTNGSGDSAEIIKTVYGNYSVKGSLAPTGSAPTPIENWIDEANEILDEFGEVTNMTASAETVAAGESAEATVSKVDGHFNINFKIPRGASGNETIDDTAGIGDTDKVWSADKDAREISALKSAIEDLDNAAFTFSGLAEAAVVSGWRLNENDGLSSANSNYKIIKYSVTAGDIIKIVSDDRFQFQTVASVPSSGTSNRVGKTYGAGTFVLEVPTTATYLIVSAPTESNANVFFAVSVIKHIDYLQNEISSINDALPQTKIRMATTVVDDKYVNKSGNETSNSSYEYAAVQVFEKEKYWVTTVSGNNSALAPVIFASRNGSYMGCYPAETSTGNITLDNQEITIPSGAEIMYVNRDTSSGAVSEIRIYKGDFKKVPAEDEINRYLPHKYQNISLEIVEDKYINRNASETSNNNYEYAYVTLQENYAYRVTTKSAWNLYVTPIVFVDENGQYLGVYPESSEQATVALSKEIITIPDGAKGMYVNRDVNSTSTEMIVEKGTVIPFDYVSDDYENYTWNAVGDSITENGYYMQEVNNIINLPYNNCGVASSTIAVNNTYLQGQSIVERVISGTYIDTDIWTIMGGLNDCLYGSTLGELAPTGSTFNTATVYGALQAICEYILNLREHARLILITPTQSVRDTWSPETYPCTIALIRQAIIDVGEYYSIPVFDAWGKSGINAFNIQKQTNPTTRDGVHLNELGADIFGEKLALEIKNALFGIDS